MRNAIQDNDITIHLLTNIFLWVKSVNNFNPGICKMNCEENYVSEDTWAF